MYIQFNNISNTQIIIVHGVSMFMGFMGNSIPQI